MAKEFAELILVAAAALFMLVAAVSGGMPNPAPAAVVNAPVVIQLPPLTMPGE